MSFIRASLGISGRFLEGQCRWRRTFDNRLALPVCFVR